MGLNVRDEPVRILAHLKEVRLFLCLLDLSAAVGALAIHELALRPEALTRGTVPALVLALVDVALLVEFTEDLLHGGAVLGVRRADELIVGRADAVPDRADDVCDVVDVRLRGDARRLRLLFDLLPVLVRARLEADVIALQALEADDRVR